MEELVNELDQIREIGKQFKEKDAIFAVIEYKAEKVLKPLRSLLETNEFKVGGEN